MFEATSQADHLGGGKISAVKNFFFWDFQKNKLVVKKKEQRTNR